MWQQCQGTERENEKEQVINDPYRCCVAAENGGLQLALAHGREQKGEHLPQLRVALCACSEGRQS